ncbi:MAG: hypothetical protein ACLSG5_15525 [Oscillospiraceae bacterium]
MNYPAENEELKRRIVDGGGAASPNFSRMPALKEGTFTSATA